MGGRGSRRAIATSLTPAQQELHPSGVRKPTGKFNGILNQLQPRVQSTPVENARLNAVDKARQGKAGDTISR